MSTLTTTTLDPSSFHPDEHWRMSLTCGGYRRWHAVEHDGEGFWQLESDWGQAHLVGIVVPAGAFVLSLRVDLSCGTHGSVSMVLCESLRLGRARLDGGGDNGLPFFVDEWATLNISLDDGLSLSGPAVGRESRWPVPAGSFAAPTTVQLRRHAGQLTAVLGGIELGRCDEQRAPVAPMLVLIGGHSQDDPPALCFGAVTVAPFPG